jgi:dienelactone hydrolase
VPSTTIDIPSSGKPQFTGELYTPAGTATSGLVVIAYGTEGFMDTPHGQWKKMMRGYAEDLAARGVFALIPDYFAKTNTPHGGPAANEIFTRRHDWVAALVDTVTVARTTIPRVDPARIGMLGFSLGGYLCLLARGAAKPKALVSFFAPMFDGIGSAGSGSVQIAQIHHGKEDKAPTEFTNAEAIKKILALERTDVEVFSYEGATHGFAGPTAADKKAETDSKVTTVKFFETRL